MDGARRATDNWGRWGAEDERGMFAGFVMLFLLCLFPELALFLPRTMQW